MKIEPIHVIAAAVAIDSYNNQCRTEAAEAAVEEATAAVDKANRELKRYRQQMDAGPSYRTRSVNPPARREPDLGETLELIWDIAIPIVKFFVALRI